MGKIDVAIIEALAYATTISVQALNDSAGTDKEHICWVKMNFIKHFTEDVVSLTIIRRTQPFHAGMAT